MDYMSEYKRWLDSDALSDDERAELRAVEGNNEEIESRFFAPLSFGTAGLRGVLGIGLPDVPIFLAAVFKTLFEISLRFGYPYNTRQEQLYQMLVICAAVGEPADRRRAASDLNLLARELQIGAGVSFSWEETKRRAAKALCSAALTGKVVQGVPIVGVYGGFRNGVLLRQIGSMAAVKYQQRLLSF